MTEKERMVEIMLEAYERECGTSACGSCKYYGENCVTEIYVDALVAYGFGDIRALEEKLKVTENDLELEMHSLEVLNKEYDEMEHRAELAERALKIASKDHAQHDEDSGMCMIKGGCRPTSCEECFQKYYFEQAEKEFAEEKNNKWKDKYHQERHRAMVAERALHKACAYLYESMKKARKDGKQTIGIDKLFCMFANEAEKELS